MNMKTLAPLFSVIAVAALLCTTHMISQPAQAQGPGRSSFNNHLTAGLDAWKSGGYKLAVRHWTEGSPLDRDRAFLDTLNAELAAVERAYGKPFSYDTIHTINLTSNTRLVYVGVHLEKGPLFMRFLNFKQRRGDWIVSEVDLGVKVDPLLTPLLTPGAN